MSKPNGDFPRVTSAPISSGEKCYFSYNLPSRIGTFCFVFTVSFCEITLSQKGRTDTHGLYIGDCPILSRRVHEATPPKLNTVPAYFAPCLRCHLRGNGTRSFLQFRIGNSWSIRVCRHLCQGRLIVALVRPLLENITNSTFWGPRCPLSSMVQWSELGSASLSPCLGRCPLLAYAYY